MEQKENLSDMELNQINTEYQCSFEQGCFVAILAKLDCEEKNQDMSALVHRLEEIIERELVGGKREYINSVTNSGVMSIINYSPELREETRDSIEKPLIMMRKELDKFHGYHVTVGVGGEKNSIGEIAASVKEAAEAIKCRCKAGLDRVIFYDQLHYKTIELQDLIDEKHFREIDNMIEALDYEALVGDIIKYENNICKMAMYSPSSVYGLLEKSTDKIIQVLKHNQTDEHIISKFELDVKRVLDFYYDVNDMTYQYGELIKETFQNIIAEKKNKSQLPIRMAKQYIQNNYSQQVSLEEVAEAINLSPAYLSTMFKKERGINFSDYLISCRMEAAKELLKTTELPIADVAEKVGYADSRYFSKTFTKVVGLKPSTYRKLYL